MTNTLKLVLTDHWFEEIKSGRKKQEFRKATPFWLKRIMNICKGYDFSKQGYVIFNIFSMNAPFVEFQKAYRKNPEKMTFKIKEITTMPGRYTDLQYDGDVYAIHLGERVK